VDRASDDFLADAALAGDEHLRVGAGDTIDFLLESCDFRTAPRELDMRSWAQGANSTYPSRRFSNTINHCL
jgi:hypothetical protein